MISIEAHAFKGNGTTHHESDNITVSYRWISILDFSLVMIRSSECSTSVELDVEFIGVGSCSIDVHTIMIVRVACKQYSYHHNC